MGEKSQPLYYGGQAVLEGVMMRGADTWAVAVRRPSGDIYVERRPVRSLAARHPLFRKPLFRGVAALADSLSIGVRALATSAAQAADEEDQQLTPRQVGIAMAGALVFFTAVFIVLPNVGLAIWGKGVKRSLTFNLIEGFIRLALFLGYMILISFMKDIRRVFMYHGAEHKTIAAYEAGEAVLEPEVVDRYSTLHVRCGTNFLIIVMILAVLVYSVFPWRALGPRILSRILAIPLVAGLSFEMLRIGAAHLKNPIVAALMKPGLWLQMITTRPPTPDQIEVAVRAFEAVLPEAERARIATLPSAVVRVDPEAQVVPGAEDAGGSVP
ncbi:MAG: DUF1385 domain-containing protein [Acidobacteria bacterium]|nr:DUF1385 domain-containing protein [Acidobacteriota bacterium]